MKLAPASLCALLLLVAHPAVTFAQFQELWTADVGLNPVAGSMFLTPIDVLDLDGDFQNEMVVNVNVGGVFYVQIRDALTGAIEFTSTTATFDNIISWRFYSAELNGGSTPELVASMGGRVLVIGYGGSVAAPAPAAQATREALLPARPNPFAGDVALAYTLVAPGRTEIEVFDVAGRLVRRLGGERVEAGEHRVDWDGRDQEGRALGPGMYFYRLNVDGRASEARRAVRLGQ